MYDSLIIFLIMWKNNIAWGSHNLVDEERIIKMILDCSSFNEIWKIPINNGDAINLSFLVFVFWEILFAKFFCTSYCSKISHLSQLQIVKMVIAYHTYLNLFFTQPWIIRICFTLSKNLDPRLRDLSSFIHSFFAVIM